jgi:hypothetical protein
VRYRAILVANSEYMGRKSGKLRDALSEPRLFSLSGRCLPIRRAERRLAMATATQNGRTPTSTSRGAEGASESAPIEFLIVEDNGGKYHWTLLDREGNSLARSPRMGSYEQAEDAARVVLAGAASARLERRGNR